MSVWQLDGIEGDLLSIRVTVEAHLLEDLLETLAQAPFPINPEIWHHVEIERDGRKLPAVHVGFPAWRSQIPQLCDLLSQQPFAAGVAITGMLCGIK